MLTYRDGSEIALVASDLDGTLLRDGACMPRPEALELIEGLVDRGAIFLAASGRQHASLRRLFGPIADRISYLCENGSLVVHEGEVVLMRTMPRPLALDICRAIEERPGCAPFVSCPSTSYTLARDGDLTRYLREITGNDVTEIGSFDEIDEPIMKVAYQASAAELPAAARYFAGLFSDVCNAVTSGAIWMDFTMPGVDKGAALAELAGALGIDPARMMAFGDNDNDREMLDYVGHPFLMRDGVLSLRALNDRVALCDTVEEELRRLLEGHPAR